MTDFSIDLAPDGPLTVVWKQRLKHTPHAWINGVCECPFAMDPKPRVAARPEGPPPWRELSPDEISSHGEPFGDTCSLCTKRVRVARKLEATQAEQTHNGRVRTEDDHGG